MCGIVGAISERNVTPLLLEGLKRLEYRGYDSAGVSVLNQGALHTTCALGKLSQLRAALQDDPKPGTIGIGHTRWATHGAPTEANAHPHCSANVSVVHNGIIENYQDLRQELMEDGAVFTSETDSEVIPHLIERELSRGLATVDAVRNAIKRLEGAFALGILVRGDEEMLVASRRGSPLIVG
ncbi:MAG: glutamine--fructose-6-phosphate aminotransferase, partial [Magnetococcales bacterium]|nr:glutamine--fructose-6-phosphate aminotransferase [Magnetococcales bacterium]